MSVTDVTAVSSRPVTRSDRTRPEDQKVVRKGRPASDHSGPGGPQATACAWQPQKRVDTNMDGR